MAEAAAAPQVRHSFAQLADSYEDLARRDEFARECRRAPDPAPDPAPGPPPVPPPGPLTGPR